MEITSMDYWTITAAIVSIVTLISTFGLWYFGHRWNNLRARTSDFNYYLIDQIVPLLRELNDFELRCLNKTLGTGEINLNAPSAEFERFKYRFWIAVQNASEALDCGDLSEYFKLSELDKISNLFLNSKKYYMEKSFQRNLYGSVKSIHEATMTGIKDMRVHYVTDGPGKCRYFVQRCLKSGT